MFETNTHLKMTSLSHLQGGFYVTKIPEVPSHSLRNIENFVFCMDLEVTIFYCGTNHLKTGHSTVVKISLNAELFGFKC